MNAPPFAPATPETLAGALRRVRQALGEAGLEEPVREARLMLALATGLSGAELITGEHQLLTADASGQLQSILARRLLREPLSRIAGRRGFFGLEFEINGDVLDPRPETEHLVEAALGHIRKDLPARILDIGTGSGAILLALLHGCPRATGVGVDISEGALGIAKKNADTLGLSGRAAFIRSDLFAGIAGRFDVILSNPPYIPLDIAHTLQPEVRLFDPPLALFAEGDGLGFYQRILADAHVYLTPQGLLGVEVGHDQAARVAELFEDAGYSNIRIIRDYAGHERCVLGIAA